MMARKNLRFSSERVCFVLFYIETKLTLSVTDKDSVFTLFSTLSCSYIFNLVPLSNLTGDGGIGKSSSLALIALDWAEGTDSELSEQFDLVFLILLRYVSNDCSLERIILDQHGTLERQRVSELELKGILEGLTSCDSAVRILYLIDGYDEYTPGTSIGIDNVCSLNDANEDSLFILSSRPGKFLHTIETNVDGELKITGFSKENVSKCAELYLGDEDVAADFISQAQENGISKLLHVPILLLMACVIFRRNLKLPDSQTEIFKEIVEWSISRTTLKAVNKTAGQIENLEELLTKLGKLSWEALQRETKQLLIKKVSLIRNEKEL